MKAAVSGGCGLKGHTSTTQGVTPTSTEEDLLVLYLSDPVTDQALQRLTETGGHRVASRNPYWDDWGVTVEDPDGYRVVFSHGRWTNNHS